MSFFPKVIKFFKLFKHQNQVLLESAGVLDSLFSDYTHVSEKCSSIIKNEQAGNEISREIARSLALTFITPIDREDIYAINTAHEDVHNSIRAIATRIGLYQFENIKPGAASLVQKIHAMITEISAMLTESSIKKDVEHAVLKIKEIKQEADTMLLVSLGEIYESPVATPQDLMNTIKWSHIYDRIEEALACTDVLANTIEGISLKNA
ncbi:MAG: DUF47 family protein [Bacteroidales bacterium]|nr:DUF47 family protein [Lentimicrobiaceae bacterium]MDD5695598.1 DUF47 family protein [Bacteroidales bacterium]